MIKTLISMNMLLSTLSLFPLLLPSVVLFGAEDDWKMWRGPNGNGVAATQEAIAVSWDEKKNIRWKATIPGRGHSSPIIVGQQVIVTTADESKQTQSVVSFDRATGKQNWLVDLNKGGLPEKIHANNTHASPTVASNGSALFVVFLHHDSIHLSSIDLSGKKQWTINAGKFAPKAYSFGYGPSPTLYHSKIIVAAEVESNGYLAAFDQKDGHEIWRTDRHGCITHSSPIVANVAGIDQILISGCKKVTSYSPDTGEELWTVAGTSQETAGTMVWQDDVVFASGGYPKKETIAIKADGSGAVLWRNRTSCFEQSLLAYDNFIYAVDDNGIAHCWNGKTGRETWRARLGGKVSSSPIFAAGNIYLTNESGTTFVFKANPEKFELVAKNQLGDECFASPAIVGDAIFHRAANSHSGIRSETLYCIAK